MGGSLKILYVQGSGNSDAVAGSIRTLDDRFDVVRADGVEEAHDRLATERVSSVVSRYRLGDGHGLDLLRAVREEHPALPFVLLVVDGDERVASEAISAGVTDYVPADRLEGNQELLAERVEQATEDGSELTGTLAAPEGPRSAMHRLQTVVSNVPIVVFALDEEGVFTLSEGKGLAGIDLAPGEVVGESAFDVYEGHDAIIADVERALEGAVLEVTREVEGRFFETTYQPTLDEDDECVGTIGVAVDVTERKERERELERVRDRMEFALDATDAIVWDRDVEDDHMEFYPDEENLYGTTVDSWEEFLEVVHPDDRRDITEEFDRVRESDGVGREEVRIRRNGELRWIEVGGRPVSREGSERLVGVARDVTDRKRKELELRRQNERLDRFAGMISHDLRNPLEVARARTTLAREECDSDRLDGIEAAHSRMERLIADILTLAREGEPVDQPTAVDLASMVQEVWAVAGSERADLVVETDATVRADPDGLRQLLENLLQNSVEHGSTGDRSERDHSVEHGSTGEESGSGGNPTVVVGSLPDGFFVEDDGPGIPAEDRERVFEGSYSTADDGTGFGLAIVRDVARAHGWEVRATEGDRGGARFEVTGVDVVGPDDQ